MKSKFRLFLCLCLIQIASPALAIDGLYLGGQVGHVALTGKTGFSFNNTIGFGVDLGFRINPLLDVLFSSHYSSHSGGINGLSLYAETLGANVHIFEANDFDLTVGAGPGFYFFKHAAKTESLFGLNLGAACDVMANEHLRIGIGLRFHKVFSAASDIGDNYWTIMMRVGYQFGN